MAANEHVAETKAKTITYFVNGEDQTATQHKLAVRLVLENAGFKPAEEYRLTRDAGHHDFTDYDDEIPLRNEERFTATFLGVTPVS